MIHRRQTPFPRHRTLRRLRRHRRNRSTKRRTTTKRHLRSGGAGPSHPAAVFSIQPDPYSAPVFANAESAQNIFEARGPYLL